MFEYGGVVVMMAAAGMETTRGDNFRGYKAEH
jgi:hypothetical protein